MPNVEEARSARFLQPRLPLSPATRAWPSVFCRLIPTGQRQFVARHQESQNLHKGAPTVVSFTLTRF
eukprot:3570373-Pleurochrysis_carterae.AAC.1